MVQDPHSRSVFMALTDQVFRLSKDSAILQKFTHILNQHGVPSFFGSFDQVMLKALKFFGPLVPSFLSPPIVWSILAVMRHKTRNVILPGEQEKLKGYFKTCKKEGTIQGKIIYKDRFGNLTTNISAELINEKFPSFDKIKIQTGKQIINGLSKAYNKIKLGEPGAIINSWNQLEIFCRQADAAKKLKLKLGQSITLKPVLHPTNKRISPIIKK